MKKLSIAVVLVAASFTFAKAQVTDSTSKVKVETAVVAPVEMKADTSVMAPATDDVKMEAMKEDQMEVKADVTADKQKARKEKREAKKLVE